MKKIVLCIVGIVGFLCSFIVGFLYCRERVIHGKSSIVQSNIERVAIVNLDEGITTDNEKVLYSGQLLKFASDYVYVGLNEAKTGVESGMYAAYIIIPPDFSECIESINGEPKQVEVEYVVNSDLVDKNRLEVEEKLFTFKELLNSNAAYVYLNSVLGEFHNVQDSAVTIMEHDKVDLENIKDINPDDIFNMIDFSEMKDTDNNMEDVDLTQYIDENLTEIDNIFSEINKGITNGQQQYQEVTKQYNLVAAAINNAKDTISTYDPLTDSKGDAVYQEGLDNLNNAIDEYNDQVDIEGLESAENIKNMIADVSNNYVLEVLERAQKHVDEELTKIQEDNRELVESQEALWKQQQADYYAGLKDYVESQTSDYNGYISEVEENEERLYGIIQDEGDYLLSFVSSEIENLTPDEILVLLKIYVEEVKALVQNRAEIQSITIQLDSYKDEENTPPDFEKDKIILPEVECLYIPPDDEREDEDGKDSEVPDNEEKLETDLTEEDSTQEETDDELEEDWEKEWISIDVDENIDVDNDVNQYVTKHDEEIVDEISYIKGNLYISKSDITNIIDEQIINSISNENQTKMDNYNNMADMLLTSIEDYDGKITGFNPYDYIKTEEITKYQTAMSKNITDIESDMNTKNAEYLQFVNLLYKNTNENITTLQGDMQEANDASKQKLNSVIAVLKSDKESISKEDDELLGSFANKLAYTRIGTLEYTEMYRFMADPITASMRTLGQKTVKKDDTEKLELDYKWVMAIALMMLMLMCVIGLTVKIVRGRKELKALENE